MSLEPLWTLLAAMGWQSIAALVIAALICVALGFGVIEFEPLDENTK